MYLGLAASFCVAPGDCFRHSWVLILAVLFVIAKQTCGIPASWWWILTNIPLGMFLQNLRADL